MVIILLIGCKSNVEKPEGWLDNLTRSDWWNIPQNDIINLKVDREDVIAFCMYTVSKKKLKLSAQLFPLYPDESRQVILEIEDDNEWNEIQKKQLSDIGWTVLFEVNNWNSTKNVNYRVRHGKKANYVGVIRRDPIEKNEIVLAALSCNSNKDRGLRENYVRNINYLDPDLIFFSGDQSYDHSQHTAAWLKFGMQFRETFRSRPSICIPDDHDVGQDNLWGDRGKKSSSQNGFDGGYFLETEYVKMVERAQTSHLPDPYSPMEIEQGISVYFTNLKVGEIDFAIIEDRKFKSGISGNVPEFKPRLDHVTKSNSDTSGLNKNGLALLGPEQLKFLENWSASNDSKMKVVLSQSPFFSGPHFHGSFNNRIYGDLDSNGWPKRARDKAVELIKKAKAIHINGDQHTAMLVQLGLDKYDDGAWSFTVPAIVNDVFSRWWWPEGSIKGVNNNANSPLPWTGGYIDGFGNNFTMHAYANPDSPSEGAGFGLIRFNKGSNEVAFECWPRYTSLPDSDAKQFVGWPITIKLEN